jgi:hypothetical protein
MLRWFKRSGHATVVAYIALFLALGGGAIAIAGGSKINGSKLKKRSVAGKKLKKNTITGTEVNENKLGKVPSAANADHATNANVAASVSTMSPEATTKANPSASGADYDAGQAAATAVTIYEDSQFRLYSKCFIDESGPSLVGAIFIETKANGAIFESPYDELAGDGDGYLNVGTDEEFREIENESALESKADIAEVGPFGAVAANGYGLVGHYQIAVKNGALPEGGDGPYGPGQVCLFNGYVVHS